jgi:hypothetical protein
MKQLADCFGLKDEVMEDVKSQHLNDKLQKETNVKHKHVFGRFMRAIEKTDGLMILVHLYIHWAGGAILYDKLDQLFHECMTPIQKLGNT